MDIREMLFADLDFALELTTAEEWSSTRADFEELLLFDQHGSFIGMENEEPIGMVCCIPYGPFGFIGNLIVKKEYRGQGKGQKLMEYAMKYLQRRRIETIMIDAVPAAESLYERLGFRKICRSLRLAGAVGPRISPDVRPMTDKDLLQIMNIDKIHFGANRFLFLGNSLSSEPDLSLVLEIDGVIAGYITGTRRHGAAHISPWIMDNHLDKAGELLQTFAAVAAEPIIKLGVLETNRPALGLFQRSGLMMKSYSWRMVAGPESYISFSDGMFAIGSPMRG
ncbi:MAG: GNAT family N-acetyltransferase [Candidatus Hodarchaeota archaeon]